MRLLVAGADRVDAGKTTFTVGLVDRLDAVGFKPRAGNDYWFDHDDVRSAVEGGRLYGKDARRLADASGGAFEPEALNPVHRLWTPTPGSRGILGRDGKQFLLDRVRGPDGDTDRFVVNDTIDLPTTVSEALPLADAERVDSVEAFNDVMADWHAPALARFADEVRATDTAVVESYGDVADPFRDVDYDAVAVVEPRRVRVYEGRRYGRACQAVGGSPQGGRLEERVGRVVDLLEPVETCALPALTGDSRSAPGAVADAYDTAYEALLDVAA